MAGRIIYYGGTSSNGLILDLDAAKRDSYPGGGTTWKDISTVSRNTTLVNSPTYSNTRNSFIFDGIDDYVSLGNFLGIGTSNRTFNFWVRWSSLPSSFGRVISFPVNDGTSDIPAFLCGLNGGGGIQYGVGGFPYDGFLVYNGYTLNTWINVCCTVTGKTVTGYFNGVLHSTTTSTGTVSTDCIGYIGRYNNYYGQYMTGQVGYFQIYNRVLSSNEILQNYNSFKGRFGL